MPRVNSLDTMSVRTSLAVKDGKGSSLNAARRQRMLRELGCISDPFVAKTRIEIEIRMRQAREEAARLEIERKSRDEAERRAENIIHTASHAHAEALAQAWAEMMARVHAEQQAITESRVRAAAEQLAGVEAVEIEGQQKLSVLYNALFQYRGRLPH